MDTDIQSLRLSDHAGCRLLVCAGSAAQAHALAAHLSLLNGAVVESLCGLQLAVPTLEQGGFDGLLLDLSCADEEGAELLRALRRQWSITDLPILAVVGETSGVRRNAALAAGASDVLSQPIDAEELVLRMRNLLAFRRNHAQHQATNARLAQEVSARAAKLDMLIKSGLLMSSTRDVSQLFRNALFEGQRLLNCDGGSLYLVTPHKTLRFTLRTLDDALPTFEIPLYNPTTGHANDHYMSVHAAVHRASVVIDDVYRETRFDVSGTKAFDAQTGYRTVSVLTVPMASHGGPVNGVLQFMNRKDPDTGAIVPFAADMVDLVEALAAQASVALENLQLMDERKAFMESLIHTIATAIDAKSPYTGRHSERVPELALMLAEAAHACDTGSLADFSFKSEDEWHEFRVGAWLHDCGKITTPEHVIDKATKLETIYNRIHEVRMRFEVLLRDADVERLKALQGADAAQSEAAQQRFERRRAQLIEDFAFVAQCNIGGESMSAEQIARLHAIAETTWLRHFDDQLGLAHEERQRRSKDGCPDLPTVETLLVNRASHLIERGAADVPDPGFGFKVQVPQHLYNLGEIYNLTVQRGTLTEEDRYKINEHMIHGIMMLERMPFPESLKRVPEYAGTHHETLTGTGYPRQLDASALSVPARIMAIADIFEALTAADRPYKTPKKFSEALSILHSLKRRGHIDPELFDLFLTSGVHMQYAEKFLSPEQVDAFDIQDYLGPVTP